MDTVTISELLSVEDIGTNDVLPIVNGGNTKKVSIEQLQNVFPTKAYVQNKIDEALSGGADLSNYLAKDNITEYTPSGDYNPSTKKYVDDSISSIPSGSGTPDNVTTRLNSSDELETIGIYTQQNTARKIWEGTKQQYDALNSKDNDTYYYITDDNFSNGLPVGGTSGQVLSKSSSTDYDVEWVSQHNFTHETWTFTLEDDTTVDKEIVLW